jgi:integrase
MTAYQTAMVATPRVPASRHGAGTFAALVTAFYRSIEFANLAASSKTTYRNILAPLLEAHGHRLVMDMPAKAARKIIEDIGATRPAMANLTRAVFGRLMAYAVQTGWRQDNPVAHIKNYKIGTHHTWTEEEIDAFERQWPLGTRQRLALALLLYTGQRAGDVVAMRRSDISDGMIRCKQKKTGAELMIAVHPALERAIKAGPSNGIYLIGDKHGRPITRQTLTRLMGEAVRSAGLDRRCVTHGLRKATMRRLAEHGSTTKEMAAVSGHRTLREVERYTQAASQVRLNKAAIERLPDKGKDEQ